MERALKRLKDARLLLIPGSMETAGHGTTAQAKWWTRELGEFLSRVPRRAP
jgi:homoserine O-acetyltransferase